MSAARLGPAIAWTSDLAIGVPELDKQHRELFRRAERLVLALDAADRGEVDPLVHSLSDFLVSHLECEERWMAEADYPKLGPHRDAHWRFKDEVRERTRAYQRQGPSPAMALAVHDWLAGWLFPHVGGPDLEFGRWLASHDGRPG